MTASFPPPLPNLFSGVTTQAGAMSALGLTAANNFSMVVGSPTGGNMGAGTINATALYVNGTAVGSTSTAAITSGNINGAIIGGTTPAAGTFSTLGFTGTLNYSGSQVLAFATGQNTYLGINAGVSNTTGGLNTFLGNGAGNANTTGGENTFVGTISGNFMSTGTFNTAIGEHALGYEPASSGNTAIGNDAMRNYISNGANTSLGKSALGNGGGQTNTAIGQGALLGNSAVVTIGGTGTAGDTVSLIFTGTFTGSPQTVSVTATAGQSSASIATALAAAIGANAVLTGTYPAQPNIPASIGATGSAIIFQFPGTSTTGATKPVITFSVTGSATETVTISGGANGSGNVAVGYQALNGLFMSSAGGNIGIGTNCLTALTTGGNNISIGGSSAVALTSGGSNIVVGYQVVGSATTMTGGTIIGTQAGAHLTTAFNVTMLGSNVGQTTATTINNCILIGSGNANVDTPTSSTGHYINIENVIQSSGTGTPLTSLTSVGGLLAVGGQTGPTWSSGTGAPSATQPNGSMYSRGDGTTGTRLYVSSGGGTWLPVAGV